MAFPTQSFTPVLSANDAGNDQNLTVTVPSSCKTLLGLFSSPGGPWWGDGPNGVSWDTAGVNEALTQQGTPQPATSSGNTWWGQSSIWVKQNPTPGTSKNTLFDIIVGGGSQQIGACVWGIDEPVTLVSNGGADFSIAGSGQQDWTIAGIATQAGDVIVAVLSDDCGTGGSTNPPTILGGTSLGSTFTGGGDSWNAFGYLVATGTSTDLTWRYDSTNSGGWGTGAVKYLVLRDASSPPAPGPRVYPINVGAAPIGLFVRGAASAGGVEARTFTSAGVGAFSPTSLSIFAATLSSTGAAASSLLSAAITPAALSSSGTATPTFTAAAVYAQPFSAAGAASVTWQSASLQAATLTSAGAAATSFLAAALTPAALSSDGLASVTWQSAAIHARTLTSDGAASVSWIGVDANGGGTIEARSLSADGAATATFEAASYWAIDLTSAGVASVAWQSAAFVASSLSAAGLGAFNPQAAQIEPRTLSSAGAAAALFDGVDGNTATIEARTFSSAGAASVSFQGVNSAQVEESGGGGGGGHIGSLWGRRRVKTLVEELLEERDETPAEAVALVVEPKDLPPEVLETLVEALTAEAANSTKTTRVWLNRAKAQVQRLQQEQEDEEAAVMSLLL